VPDGPFVCAAGAGGDAALVRDAGIAAHAEIVREQANERAARPIMMVVAEALPVPC